MAISNTKALCYVLGWQGGTVHQVANALQVTTRQIIDADENEMDNLLRMAQACRRDTQNLMRAN